MNTLMQALGFRPYGAGWTMTGPGGASRLAVSPVAAGADPGAPMWRVSRHDANGGSISVAALGTLAAAVSDAACLPVPAVYGPGRHTFATVEDVLFHGHYVDGDNGGPDDTPLIEWNCPLCDGTLALLEDGVVGLEHVLAYVRARFAEDAADPATKAVLRSLADGMETGDAAAKVWAAVIRCDVYNRFHGEHILTGDHDADIASGIRTWADGKKDDEDFVYHLHLAVQRARGLYYDLD